MNRLTWSDVASQQHFTSGQALPPRFVSQPVVGQLVALAYSLGLTPNQLTLLGLLPMLGGCLLYIQGSFQQLFLTGFLWQASLGSVH